MGHHNMTCVFVSRCPRTGETRQRVFSRFQHAQQSHGTVDMHTHTTDSDGDFTPEEVIEFAHTRGLKSVWITDHDLIRPLERIKTLIAAGDNVRCIMARSASLS